MLASRRARRFEISISMLSIVADLEDSSARSSVFCGETEMEGDDPWRVERAVWAWSCDICLWRAAFSDF